MSEFAALMSEQQLLVSFQSVVLFALRFIKGCRRIRGPIFEGVRGSVSGLGVRLVAGDDEATTEKPEEAGRKVWPMH